jgi:hypothetical protein
MIEGTCRDEVPQVHGVERLAIDDQFLPRILEIEEGEVDSALRQAALYHKRVLLSPECLHREHTRLHGPKVLRGDDGSSGAPWFRVLLFFQCHRHQTFARHSPARLGHTGPSS